MSHGLNAPLPVNEPYWQNYARRENLWFDRWEAALAKYSTNRSDLQIFREAY